MVYDPFVRGAHPVGVTTAVLTDSERDDRSVPIEVWYPALARFGGQDLAEWTRDRFEVIPGQQPKQQMAVRDVAPAAGSFPVVVFSHTSGGHRRQASYLTTHLASHGYVVAAPDHTGNTAADFATRAKWIAEGNVPDPADLPRRIATLIGDRVPDLRLVLDRVLGGGVAAVSSSVDATRVGIIGYSFGGWAALALPEADERCTAVVGLAPAGSNNPVPGVLPVTLAFGWKQPVATLLLTGDEDRWTPLDGVMDVYRRTPDPKAMFVLSHAGHGHFGDDVDDDATCPAAVAHAFARSLTVAHFDVALKGVDGAKDFLATRADSALAAHGIPSRRQL